ncbi:hypothetical protein Nepgr_024920 [Nepenthes gracilis]|uniref:NAB domain-containing protein n=1 Tax=Nepenthes gracilis TaxID=150966 RepID=A0AAD3T5F9_NEPGR|nr:hypothetical protein Nepgr_024920 [Nepenthes gracilis]
MDATIKLIEENEDSIARRDEMYSRKWPVLMKLIEEFYRAYSSFVKRYDGATGELLLAHQITGEAFPTQVSFLLADDAPSNSEPNTPFTRIPTHAFDPEESGTAVGRKGLKHQEEDQEDLAQLLNKNKNLKTRILIESERAHKAETELQTLTQILIKTESERDAFIVKYRQISERLSNVMKDIVPAQRYNKELEEHAKLMNEQARIAKNEVEVLKNKILELNQEKEHAALLYNQCMEVMYNQQSELQEAQEQAVLLTNVIRWGYAKLVHSEECRFTLGRLNESLHSEAHNLEQKLAIKDQQLSKMQANLEKLINNLQDQRCWFVQVEGTLHTLLNLHSKSQEEHRAITSELRNTFQMLRGLEFCKKDLEVNQILNDLTLPSSEFKRSVESEISSLREIKQDQVCHLMDDFRNPFGVPEADDILYHQLEVTEPNSTNPSSEPRAKRQLGMDKLEISNEGSSSNEEPKMENILDRFAPDAQNLMGLKDSVQELRAKLETIEKRKIVKDVEHGKLRDRLQDVENSVTQLLGLHTEPRKTTEDHPPPTSDVVRSLELKKIGIVQRKVVLNKVRRGSEMIGRLQMEIKKIQYALQKLRDQNKNEGRRRFSLIHILRDFVCGGCK